MKTPTMTRGARLRTLATAGSIAAALALVGCSGGTVEEPTTPDEGTSSETGSADLAQRVADYMAVDDSYDMPTEPITDGSVIEGKTIHYIPITNQAPQFALTAAILENSVAAAGAKLQVCNGEGNPTTIGQCVDGAKNDPNVAAIVTDGFYYGMAANALNAAQEAGVKIVYSNQFADPAFPEGETLANVNAPGVEMFTEVMSWVALDSEGSANVLVIKSADGPGTVKFIEDGKPQFLEDCPDCTYSEIESTTATSSQLASELGSKLLQDPNINYVVPQFAQYLPIVIPALQNSDAQIGTGASTLGALQAVQGGAVAAASGQSAPFGAWAIVDTVLRMHNGQDIYPYVIPTRLFTAENIGDVDVSEAGEASGEWYGPATFADEFKKLWGVA